MAPSSTPLIALVVDDASVRTRPSCSSRRLATRAFSSAEDFLRAPEIGQMSCRILHLPRMSGTELHSLLLQRGLRIATISITARPGDEVKARVAAHRPIRFLIKPFTPAALVRCIRPLW